MRSHQPTMKNAQAGGFNFGTEESVGAYQLNAKGDKLVNEPHQSSTMAGKAPSTQDGSMMEAADPTDAQASAFIAAYKSQAESAEKQGRMNENERMFEQLYENQFQMNAPTIPTSKGDYGVVVTEPALSSLAGTGNFGGARLKTQLGGGSGVASKATLATHAEAGRIDANSTEGRYNSLQPQNRFMNERIARQGSSLAAMTHLTKHGNEVQYSKLGTSYRNLSRGSRGHGGLKNMNGVRRPVQPPGLSKAASALEYNYQGVNSAKRQAQEVARSLQNPQVWDEHNSGLAMNYKSQHLPQAIDARNKEQFKNMVKSPYQMPQI